MVNNGPGGVNKKEQENAVEAVNLRSALAVPPLQEQGSVPTDFTCYRYKKQDDVEKTNIVTVWHPLCIFYKRGPCTEGSNSGLSSFGARARNS